MAKKFVLGLAPTRRDTRDFDLKYAHDNKAEIGKRIREIVSEMNVEIADIDWLNEEGLLIYPEEAEKVARYFYEKKVDAVIVPHCNFGAEEPVAKLGKLLGKPVLLWGPRDKTPPPDGPRQTDTQCGLFATSMILDRYNVRYTVALG
jgi:L-fucose isomerase-like protein